MGSAGQKCNHFRARKKPKFYFLSYFSVVVKMKFWRHSKYTTAFGLSIYPALPITDVAWRFCALFPSLFRTVTAWSLETDFVSGFPKFHSPSLNSATELKFRRCSALLLKASDRFRRCLRIDWKSFYSIPLCCSDPLKCPKEIEKSVHFSL